VTFTEDSPKLLLPVGKDPAHVGTSQEAVDAPSQNCGLNSVCYCRSIAFPKIRGFMKPEAVRTSPPRTPRIASKEWGKIPDAKYRRIDMRPKTEGILESSLYVDDVTRSVQFYEKIFGFQLISDFGGRGCAMQAGNRQVLLIFKKGASLAIPSPHDGDGELHVAFAILAAELSAWEAWLAENGITVEEKRQWERGGWSLYFRDPDRHLLEVATPGVWSIY
jgi:catechol 2,3-dioxygenase-like lactoylglutathione lyase family enzyme